MNDPYLQELERPPPDELWGFRLHAWVLVRPSKEVDEAFFLEPSTGFRHAVGHPGYHHVASVWNHANYWVNVQPDGDKDTCEVRDDAAKR